MLWKLKIVEKWTSFVKVSAPDSFLLLSNTYGAQIIVENINYVSRILLRKLICRKKKKKK